MVTASCGFADPDSLYWAGPTISVEVGFDPAFNPRNPVRPTLPSTPWSGLVDTGAIDCCIDSEVAQLLDLPIVDQGFISGAGGSVLRGAEGLGRQVYYVSADSQGGRGPRRRSVEDVDCFPSPENVEVVKYGPVPGHRLSANA